jgi:hypothetical protein
MCYVLTGTGLIAFGRVPQAGDPGVVHYRVTS